MYTLATPYDLFFRNVFIPSLFFNGIGMHSLINNAVTKSKNGKQCPNSRIYVLSKMDKHDKLNVKKEVIRDKFY